MVVIYVTEEFPVLTYFGSCQEIRSWRSHRKHRYGTSQLECRQQFQCWNDSASTTVAEENIRSAEACAKRDLDVAPVLKELERQQQRAPVPEANWQMAPLKQLTDHIVQKHHIFTLASTFDLIRDLATKVERRHGSQHPEVFQVSDGLASISAELTHHFFCEENILFPYVAQLEARREPGLAARLR